MLTNNRQDDNISLAVFFREKLILDKRLIESYNVSCRQKRL